MNEQIDKKVGGSGRALTTRPNELGSLNLINLTDETQLAKAEVFLKKYIQSDKSGIKSIQDGLAILARAQDLNLPFTACAEHISVIGGKTVTDIHIVKSLLLRAGITWECTKDYIPQYQYTDGNTIYIETQLPDYCVKCRTAEEAEKATVDNNVGVYPVKWFTDLKGNVYNEFQVSDKCVIAINKAHALKLANENKFPIIRIPARPIDFVTEYKFTRIMLVHGERKVMTSVGKFSYSDAQQAELLNKDTYKKYPKILVGHRAFTLGARDIGDDVLMGCLEKTEAKIIFNDEITDAEFEELKGEL